MQITGSNILALVCREVANYGFRFGAKLNVLQASFEGFVETALRASAYRVQVRKAACLEEKN